MRRRVRLLGRLIFVLYLAALTYFLFLADWYNRGPGSHPTGNMNLVPFLEIRRFWRARHVLPFFSVFLNLAGNVIGFIPFGFCLPVVTRRMRHAYLVIPLGFLTSFTIELVQFLTRTGTADVDDVILNTCGCAIGYILVILLDEIRKKAAKIHFGRKVNG